MDQLIAGEIDVINVDFPLGKLDPFEDFEMGVIDTNGWQVDYWATAIYKGVELDISGSMYYGNMKIVLYRGEE
jgi:hypothetical protein